MGGRWIAVAAPPGDGQSCADRIEGMPRRLTFNWHAGGPKPEGAVLVMRPYRFGNPFKYVADEGGGYAMRWVGKGQAPPWFAPERAPDRHAAHRRVVELHRRWIGEPEQAGVRALARERLRGRDLACICPPGQSCHADVLLEIANAP
jgi:hypothetical protein